MEEIETKVNPCRGIKALGTASGKRKRYCLNMVVKKNNLSFYCHCPNVSLTFLYIKYVFCSMSLLLPKVKRWKSSTVTNGTNFKTSFKRRTDSQTFGVWTHGSQIKEDSFVMKPFQSLLKLSVSRKQLEWSAVHLHYSRDKILQ